MPRRHVTGVTVTDTSIGEVSPVLVYGVQEFSGITVDPNVNEWSAMMYRSEWEVANEGAWPAPHVMTYGGEHEQCWTGVQRWDADPNRIVWAHDIGGHWLSADAGRTYRHTRSKGFGCVGSQSIAIHPTSGRVICQGVNAWMVDASAVNGLYTSDDWMETWTLRHAVRMGDAHGGAGQLWNPSEDYNFRSHGDWIAFDRTFNADRVVAVCPGNQIATSTNAGSTWTNVLDLKPNPDIHDVYRVLLSKKVNGRGWIACAGRPTSQGSAHAGLIQVDNLWGTPTLSVIATGLPVPAGNVFVGNATNGVGHVRWIDFANPATQDGDLIVTSVSNGYYRIPMSATHLPTGNATQWIIDTNATKLTVCPANPNMMVRFDRASPTNILRTSADAGVTWRTALIQRQPAPWRDTGNWKGTVGGQWDTHTWHPTYTPAELVFHSHAMNWIVRNFSNTVSSTVVPANDYIGGWNSGAGRSRTDYASPSLQVQSFMDHGCAYTPDNGQTYYHLDTPANLEYTQANGSSNGAALRPASTRVVAAIGEHNEQQVYTAADYTLNEAAVWVKVGDTNGNGIMEAGEGNNFGKLRPANFYLPGTNFFYSGNQRANGAAVTGLSSIGGNQAIHSEMIGYTRVAKSAGNWVVWCATWYNQAGGLAKRQIWRGTVDPAGTGAPVWDGGGTTPYYEAAHQLFPDGFPFAPDPNNIANIYTLASDGGIQRWNGTAATNLGLMAHPDLVGDATYNKVTSICVDPNDSNHGAVIMRQPGFPAVFRTTNLLNASPIWENISTNFSHLPTGTIEVNPWTSELVYDGPFGRFVYPPPVGVDRGNQLMSTHGIRYSEVHGTSLL